jgi:hypothetical protein
VKESDHPSLDSTIGQQDFLEIEDGDTEMDLEEQELDGVDPEHLEHAYKHKKMYTIPRDQLWKVHKVFLNSSTRSIARSSKGLGI